MRAYSLGKGDVVLVPEFICESLLQPIEELGARADYYPVDASLQPEWPVLEEKAARAASVVMVHYFGQPQDVIRFRALADRFRLVLIEDNAHGFASRDENGDLGTLGDIGISSPRKSLGTLNGAFLACHRPVEDAAFELPLQPLDAELGSVDTRLGSRLLSWAGLGRRAGSPIASQRLRERKLPDWSLDEAMRDYIAAQDVESVRAARRRVYDVWSSQCGRLGLRPVFRELSPGAAPLAFPAWAVSRAQALRWYRWGRDSGVEVFSWPTLPRALCRRGSLALEMWTRLVCFPVHQHIDPEELAAHVAGL
jgi:hypothetical protein